MSHAYPLARSASEALQAASRAARTRAEAEALAGEGEAVAALETEWLTVGPDNAGDMLRRAEEGVGEGFVQRYEDASGAPVLAVTFWRLADGTVPRGQKPAAPPAPKAAAPLADDTDDLYFRKGRTKKRRASRIDPRQMDLFSSNDANAKGG